MSQAQFQEALATLIRLPDHNRLDIEEFLERYELSSQDRDNLRHIADHREAFKFGYKMRRGRINFLLESIPISLEYIDQNQLIAFIEKEFDPVHTMIHARKIYRAFKDYFSSKENSRHALITRYFGDLPEFFWDLFTFEILDAELEFQGFRNLPVPQESVLKHAKFETLSLNFKIHSFVEKKRSTASKKRTSAGPQKKRTHLLFLSDDEIACGYQIFEIDETGIDFLSKSLRGEPCDKPSYYQDFVDCGLCK